MREHKQICERYNSRIPGCKEAAERLVDAQYQQLQSLYGDRIVYCRCLTLDELYACELLDKAYLINLSIDLPDIEPVCLPEGFLL